MSAAKGVVPWNAGTGLGWLDRRGYRWIRVNGKNVREHRHVMSLHLGRQLRANEVVHHLNEDRADNRIENLAIMANGEHTRVHHSGEKRPDEAKARMARSSKMREEIARLRTVNADLLASLEEQVAEFDKRLREYVENGDDAIAGIAMSHHGDRMDRARAAIAKARGSK